MGLGYLTMHLTFVSLYVSLRRLGSNFWLATSVLFSSAFGCLFGILVTIRLGVPMNAVLLSEGLPFLVVLIGFEKPIILTKAVLSASLAMKKPHARANSLPASNGTRKLSNQPPTIQTAIQVAVKEVGYEIIWDYAVEILFLVLGAASGVQGGLCQFCFLAAWILFFDCILLFTFYTAILTIKLEINRIKRHVALRRALEEDGVSRKVAEEVAANDEWPKLDVFNGDATSRPYEGLLFGGRVRDSHISKFKAIMVTIFLGINIINLASIPFRSGARSTGSAISSVVTQPPMDPFKVAGSGLDNLLSNAKRAGLATKVTVMTPIKYELAYPSVYYALPDANNGSIFDMDFTDHILERVGGRVVESILKSLEDPLLSKWVIIALGLSLLLNGYLFNAARWSIKDPAQLGVDAVSRLRSLSHATGMEQTPATQPTSKDDSIRQAVTQKADVSSSSNAFVVSDGIARTPAECEALVKENKASLLDDEDLIKLAVRGKIPGYALEKTLGDKTRAVKIRRGLVSRTPATTENTALLENSLLPYENYDYDRVFGACCENVIGYLPLPLGVAGPIIVDGRSYYLPMATTEGVLVASTSRGAKAINAGGGAITVLTGDGMTRGPCVGFDTLVRAGEAKLWLDSEEGTKVMKAAFNSTSRFARLQSLKTALAGTYLYIRFRTTTGDAMGMNMISKGVEHALKVMSEEAGFEDMSIISVSGNYCIDKKPSAINWIEGRGKSVVAEAIIPADVVRNVLKSDVDALVELNISKNLIGSAMSGSIGGNNAHAANIVAAIFLATGQDPAQVVESSMCITTMRK